MISSFPHEPPPIHLQKKYNFPYFLSHRKCRNFSIILQMFSKNIAYAEDEFVREEEDAAAGVQAAAAVSAGVSGVKAVAAPKAEAKI